MTWEKLIPSYWLTPLYHKTLIGGGGEINCSKRKKVHSDNSEDWTNKSREKYTCTQLTGPTLIEKKNSRDKKYLKKNIELAEVPDKNGAQESGSRQSAYRDTSNFKMSEYCIFILKVKKRSFWRTLRFSLKLLSNTAAGNPLLI